jgi:uncharacterized protein with PQ loop repeat
MFKPVPMKVLLTGTSICASMSTYHQVHKIRNRKDSRHISLINIGAVWVNATSNLLYAIAIKEPRLTMTFSNSCISLSTLLFTTLYYRYNYIDTNIDRNIDIKDAYIEDNLCATTTRTTNQEDIYNICKTTSTQTQVTQLDSPSEK